MRTQVLTQALFLMLQPALGVPAHAAETVPKTVDLNLPYPAAVALMQEPAGWTFRQNGTGLPLYFNERDSPEKSVCNSKCEQQWHPLFVADPKEKALGEWSIFVRKDGRRQWAFKGRPVYLHMHDTRTQPTGDGEGGVWHLMPHFLASAKAPG
jgi:predicted lipoprotein with Yx(FWY)xxD motif